MITPVGAPVYVSVRAGAGRAGVSTRTIKRWIVAGLLPAYRLNWINSREYGTGLLRGCVDDSPRKTPDAPPDESQTAPCLSTSGIGSTASD
jgi:hypothetical protein